MDIYFHSFPIFVSPRRQRCIVLGNSAKSIFSSLNTRFYCSFESADCLGVARCLSVSLIFIAQQ